uniref:Uncharacterized protein n=1 Tax=Rhabditophanes sp. KR3021 TaxID=114890 RepID=A0AC35U824_9BILA
MLAPEEITDTPSTVITENEPISISKKSDEQSSLSKKEEKESFKKFKKLIFKHPLLPVLLLQLNLCEQAMLSVDDPTPISMKPMEEVS